MSKTWVGNTTSRPKPIDGRMVLPGDGVFVDDGAPAAQRLALSVIDEPGKAPVIEVDGQRYGLIPEANAQGLVSGAGNLTAAYDGSGRMLSLARAGGRRVTIAYPSSTAMVVTEQDVPTPAIITCITDTSGRVTSAAPNW